MLEAFLKKFHEHIFYTSLRIRNRGLSNLSGVEEEGKSIWGIDLRGGEKASRT